MTSIGEVLPVDDLPVYDSDLRAPAALEELTGLLRFRDLVWQLVRTELVARYKRSYLGILWTMLNPIGTTLVLVVALSQAFGDGTNYALHVMAGLMVWNFFSFGTQSAIQRSLAGSRELPGVYVPRTVYATASIGTALVNLLLATIPVLLLLLACGQPVHPSVALLPLPLALLGMFALGVSLLVASLSVRFTDVAQCFTMALPAWLYLTPVIYPAKVLSPTARFWITYLNPLAPLVEMYRAPFLGQAPGWHTIGLATVGSVVTLAAGWLAFTAQTDELGRTA